MQLMLISGIAFAIAAVAFALQNNTPVTVALAIWEFHGSLALVLLISLGLGALIMAFLSSPAAIRGQWAASRLRRQVADLERQASECQARNQELVAELARLSPTSEADGGTTSKPYVGLRTIVSGEPDNLARVPPDTR